MSATFGSRTASRNWSFPAEAEIGVEIVVEALEGDEVFAVDGSAEPLEGIVAADSSTWTWSIVVPLSDAAHGEAVDFVVREERDARVFDADVAEHAAVVGVVGAAVLGTDAAFDDGDAAGDVQGGVPRG